MLGCNKKYNPSKVGIGGRGKGWKRVFANFGDFILLRAGHQEEVCGKHYTIAWRKKGAHIALVNEVAAAEHEVAAADEGKVADPYNADEHGRHWHGIPVENPHPLENVECVLLANSTMLLRQLEGMGCRVRECRGAMRVETMDVTNMQGSGSFHMQCDTCDRKEVFATGMCHEVKHGNDQGEMLVGYEGTMLVLGLVMNAAYAGHVVQAAGLAGIPGIHQAFVYACFHAMEKPVEKVTEEGCEFVRKQVE